MIDKRLLTCLWPKRTCTFCLETYEDEYSSIYDQSVSEHGKIFHFGSAKFSENAFVNLYFLLVYPGGDQIFDVFVTSEISVTSNIPREGLDVEEVTLNLHLPVSHSIANYLKSYNRLYITDEIIEIKSMHAVTLTTMLAFVSGAMKNLHVDSNVIRDGLIKLFVEYCNFYTDFEPEQIVDWLNANLELYKYNLVSPSSSSLQASFLRKDIIPQHSKLHMCISALVHNRDAKGIYTKQGFTVL